MLAPPTGRCSVARRSVRHLGEAGDRVALHRIVEQHATYGVVLLALAGMGAGNYYGLDRLLGGRFPAWFRTWFMSGDPNPPSDLTATPSQATPAK
jgi:hypothetical protein